MLHVAPELCFIKRFESLPQLEYLTADIESPLANIKMDIHDIPFPENTFDIIFCNHVLEHVQDDKKAMSEMLRVLKPGGWAILQIPIFKPLIAKTIEDPTLEDPKKRAEAIVKAVTNFNDPKILAKISEDLGEAMVGINEQEIELLMAERGK